MRTTVLMGCVFLLLLAGCSYDNTVPYPSHDEIHIHGLYGYLESPTTTDMPLADTYYPINGTFINNPADGFYYNTSLNAIVYNNSLPRYFRITYHATLDANKNNVENTIAIKVNETVFERGAMSNYLKYSDERAHVSSVLVVRLNPGDYVQLVTKNNQANVQITFEELTASIQSFFEES